MKQLNGQIGGSNLRKRIKETNHYKGLSRLMKKMFLSSNNIKQIQHALNVIDNKGFELWSATSNYRYNSLEIIKELVNG